MPRLPQKPTLFPYTTLFRSRPCRDGYRNLCTRVQFAGHGGQDGAMREFMAWPDHLLYGLPDGVSDAGGAVLEPLRSEEHTSELQSRRDLVCRLLLEKNKPLF